MTENLSQLNALVLITEPPYKMQDIKILSSFILGVIMTQTMTFMMMTAMSSKQKARSLSKLRRRQINLEN